ncbi:sirohydrochlorin chelatase [Candidatus Methylospira mobilis]|uniref:Sirohydrochlorin chelatase n=1 Tax=Candidatus Methylospira mobilis TaxID=1808979 RepID=A0A5Q0BMD3_9GAMM|nr:sirohydrochlorin chelatase [Candidatus Methylospira mobilis]QFY43278.1 sirohydrochlorin chelatase [Candidatus Methylospira mobilis]WNV03519.1 sirohydrochlorin chelatase [Candidatus Methylospira mobilis]
MNKTDTLLLVGHGSRNTAGNLEIEQFAGQWRARHPDWRIVVCFIEFAEVLLAAGLDLAARDSQRVIVVPLILNAAGHVKMEIPEAIEHARLRHPDTEFVCARHLGACEEILAVLKRNQRSALAQLDYPDPHNTGVILIGRGSSDRVANGEVAKIARWLYEESAHSLVDIAFTGITYPRLESVVQRQATLGMRQIVLLPYYLFTGTLIERIKRQNERLRMQYPSIHFASGDYFGFEPEIQALLERRIDEANGVAQARAMMECDGCKYREFAADQGKGHQH